VTLQPAMPSAKARASFPPVGKSLWAVPMMTEDFSAAIFPLGLLPRGGHQDHEHPDTMMILDVSSFPVHYSVVDVKSTCTKPYYLWINPIS
jgi:hypothetical protein